MDALTTRRGHKNWLIVSAIVIASFGPVFALSSAESTSGLSRWTLELLNGPGGGSESFADGTTRFMSALAGGFLFGWGVMVFAIRAWVYDAVPEGVRRSALVGFCSWFVLDSAGSIASGHPWNVVFNTLVLLVGVGPMWMPAREDRA